MQLFRKNESAVSPVIGVMLMLVVTVILAAAVSGFSGGLVGDTSKPSQMAIKADYSQSRGLTIAHMGGDIINTLDTNIIVAATRDFGSYQQLKWEVNSSAVKITKNGIPREWANASATGSSGLARTFQPGEVAFVSSNDLARVQPRTYGSTGNTDATSQYYGFTHANARGQRFVLSFVDSDGKTIAKTDVVIQP